MTNAMAKSTALEQWRPDFGPLPDGWAIAQCTITHEIHRGFEADVEFVHGPRMRPHFLRIRANPATPDVREWLYPLMEHLARLDHEVSAEVDARMPFYPQYGR